jgi:erythromycin esterase-like protein
MNGNSGRSWRKTGALLVLWLFPFGSGPHRQTNLLPGQAALAEQTPASAEGRYGDKLVRLDIPTHPLSNEQDLDVLMREIGDARVVLLGEASHGTAEYYNWRAAISRRLIKEKGFDFIAVEGEWADSYRVNQFVKGEKKDSAATVALLGQYNRWPTWMWGNYEVASLVTWLNGYNQAQSAEAKAGFFGLDVYCLWESMTELMPLLPRSESAVVSAAQKVHRCFQPYSADAQQYAEAVVGAGADCQGETLRLWNAVRKLENVPGGAEARFVLEQNALVALNGERYYRSMVDMQGESSWNIRDRHMAQTLKRLLDFHGRDSKAIVWEHNTHVGDARYTDMARSGEVNVGQLVRKEYGEENVFIVGFGSHQGSVIASRAWGAPYQKMEVPVAVPGSWEYLLGEMGPDDKMILSKDIRGQKALKRPIGHRAIGVVYDPRSEHLGNYVPSVIPNRYDAFLYLHRTQALHPIPVSRTPNEPPDLYPSGT